MGLKPIAIMEFSANPVRHGWCLYLHK